MQDSVTPLREAGLRVTRPRTGVLDVLDDARRTGRHLPVAEVVEGVRARIGRVSTQAVYDCLDAFDRAGVARRVELAGGPARWESRVGDNHHHLACRSCGAVVDVDCAVGAAPCLTPGDHAGFVVHEAEVTYWGLCPRCAPAASNGTVSVTEKNPPTHEEMQA